MGRWLPTQPKLGSPVLVWFVTVRDLDKKRARGFPTQLRPKDCAVGCRERPNGLIVVGNTCVANNPE